MTGSRRGKRNPQSSVVYHARHASCSGTAIASVVALAVPALLCYNVSRYLSLVMSCTGACSPQAPCPSRFGSRCGKQNAKPGGVVEKLISSHLAPARCYCTRSVGGSHFLPDSHRL